ncbi:MAG: 50S ribosomal protein L13 [candidate division WOR-3 bacterium]|uniref:Large ribosomal subunit protein uL13 n=1 Tax=candidate division WOR-3 bacterium TaxID=2052148 RepID=A0A7V4CHV5_UNCW3
MKTTIITDKEKVERKWWLVDAKGKILGRLASKIAFLLMGKHKPYYTPHIDCGDFVIVINASQIKVTGKKEKKKVYYWHTGYPGGLKSMTFEEMMKKNPKKVIELAVKRMLPKNRLRKYRLKRLKIYLDDKHLHQAQKNLIVEAKI